MLVVQEVPSSLAGLWSWFRAAPRETLVVQEVPLPCQECLRSRPTRTELTPVLSPKASVAQGPVALEVLAVTLVVPEVHPKLKAVEGPVALEVPVVTLVVPDVQAPAVSPVAKQVA